jgi:hypothetical protein
MLIINIIIIKNCSPFTDLFEHSVLAQLDYLRVAWVGAEYLVAVRLTVGVSAEVVAALRSTNHRLLISWLQLQCHLAVGK